MEKEVSFWLEQDYGLGYMKIGAYSSLEQSIKEANSRRAKEESFFRILEVVTTKEVVSDLTVPALPPLTLEEIANEIISDADCRRNIYWGDDFEGLSIADKETVKNMVEESLDVCDVCGCYHDRTFLIWSDFSGGYLCDSCFDDEEELQEEEDED